MKKLLLIPLLLLPICAKAQVTNVTPVLQSPIVTLLSGGLPPLNTNSTLFTDGKLEIRAGVIQQGITGSSYESSLGVSYFFSTNLAATVDCINGGVSSLDALHVGLEFVYPYKAIRLGAFLMGGRNFAGETWEGKTGIRLSYVPFTTVAPNTFLYVEQFLLINGKSNFSGSQPLGFEAGFGYRF